MTMYEIKLRWRDIWKTESVLHYKWMIYTIYLWEMYIVEVEWEYFNNTSGIYLNYLADDDGWYGTIDMDRAKYCVECYLTDVLKYKFDALDIVN